MKKCAIIIGAGPAGLTAAYELATKTDIQPIILEKTNDIGGLSKTVIHHGNRMDIGGHRFFSKSDIIMKWWLDILPLQDTENKDSTLKEHSTENPFSSDVETARSDLQTNVNVMLIRRRVSRIFFLQKFFDYPIKINRQTISNLGLLKITKILGSYLWTRLFPVKNIRSLEDFFISRFGQELYKLFFKDYTEKIWGVPCAKIAADWGAQRIKDLSIFRALRHAVKSIFKQDQSLQQKEIDTSLIERFLYPKFGPGQMWQTVAERIEKKGGVIIKNADVIKLNVSKDYLREVIYYDNLKKETSVLTGDYYFSSMPVKDLINAIGNMVPDEVKRVSDGLRYRDSITVGLLLDKLKIKNETKLSTKTGIVPDNWIYIQEKNVRLARLQIYNNWSPFLINDPRKIWIGLEYCCHEGDDLWQMNDNDFAKYAINELQSISMIDAKDVLDCVIVRTPKTYPAYYGTYGEFDVIRNFTDKIYNLFLIGRNGMHKYYNQDHAMLTAMAAVNNVLSKETSKDNIWNINAREEYIEVEDDE
jgi:protoporphyrinogen oxidase